MPIFKYSTAETEYLKQKDPALGRVIDQVGPIEREVIPDLFEALTNAIVGQQISTKAQATIWARIKSAHPRFTPALADALTAEELQRFGISLRKASYIKDAAKKILSEEFNLAALEQMPDEEVCRALIRSRESRIVHPVGDETLKSARPINNAGVFYRGNQGWSIPEAQLPARVPGCES